jgi:hypothetical protein
LMYFCDKAIHLSRPEDKAFKQVLGAPPGDTVATWLKCNRTPPFRVDCLNAKSRRSAWCTKS